MIHNSIDLTPWNPPKKDHLAFTPAYLSSPSHAFANVSRVPVVSIQLHQILACGLLLKNGSPALPVLFFTLKCLLSLVVRPLISQDQEPLEW